MIGLHALYFRLHDAELNFDRSTEVGELGGSAAQGQDCALATWYVERQAPACEFTVLTPVSDFKGLPYLLRQGELLRLREPQKWILRPIWGLGGCT